MSAQETIKTFMMTIQTADGPRRFGIACTPVGEAQARAMAEQTLAELQQQYPDSTVIEPITESVIPLPKQ